MQPSALSALIQAIPSFAVEARKKPFYRQPIPYGDTKLDFEIFQTIVEQTHYRLSQIIKKGIEKYDKRLKKFAHTYHIPILSPINSRFEEYLTNLAEALRIELELEQTSEEVKIKLAQQKEEPLGVLASRLAVIKEANELYQREKQSRIEALKPALTSALTTNRKYLSQLLSSLSLTDKQINKIHEQLASLPPDQIRQRVYQLFGSSDFSQLPKEVMADDIDSFIDQTRFVSRLQQEAINQVFTTHVKQEIATASAMLLPQEILANKQSTITLLKAITDEASINSILPKQELAARLAREAAKNNITLPVRGLVEQIVEVVATKTPTKPMLVEPLSQIFAGYESHDRAKKELTDALNQREKSLLGLSNYNSQMIERLIDLAIEDSLLATSQRLQLSSVEELETQISQGVRQTLATHEVMLTGRQLQELNKIISNRIQTSPQGISIKKAIGQAVDEAIPSIPHLDKVIDPSGTRLSQAMTSQIEKVIKSRKKEPDVLAIARDSLAQVLLDYSIILTDYDQQLIIDRFLGRIQIANLKGGLDESIKQNIRISLQEILKQNPRLKKMFELTHPDGKSVTDIFTDNTVDLLNLVKGQNIPLSQQEDALSLIIRTSIHHTFFPLAQQETEAILGNQLLIKTPAFIEYLTKEMDASDFFRRRLLFNMTKHRKGILDKIARQITKRDKKISLVQRFFKSKATRTIGWLTATLMLLEKISPPLEERYKQEATDASKIDESLNEDTQGLIEMGLALPLGALALYLNRKKILLELKRRIPWFRKIIALKRLRRWQQLYSVQAYPPSLFARYLTRLRFFRLGKNFSLGSVFLTSLQNRFPRLFSKGNFILSRNNIRSFFSGFIRPNRFLNRLFSFFQNFGSRFISFFRGRIGNSIKGLFSRLSSIIPGPINWGIRALSSLGALFQGQFDEALRRVVPKEIKIALYAIIGVIIFIFFFPINQTTTQSAFITSIENIPQDEYEKEFPTLPGEVPSFGVKDRLVPCNEATKITVPNSTKNLFTGLGKTNRCFLPEMIVIHWSGGTSGNKGTYEYLNNHPNGYSCQLATDEIDTWQMLEFYNDRVEYGRCVNGIDQTTGYTHNSLAISIEMNGAYFDSNPPSEEEVKNTIQVTCWLLKKYIVPKYGDDAYTRVFGHFQLTRGKLDPGIQFLEEFKQHLKDECVISSSTQK